MAENRFWLQVRLTYESLAENCPENHRTATLVHLVTGETFEANHVRPDALDSPEWISVQSDFPGPVEVRYVREQMIGHIEIKYIAGGLPKAAIGFTVD